MTVPKIQIFKHMWLPGLDFKCNFETRKSALFLFVVAGLITSTNLSHAAGLPPDTNPTACDDGSVPGEGEVCCKDPQTGQTTAVDETGCCGDTMYGDDAGCCDGELYSLELEGCCGDEGGEAARQVYTISDEGCCDDEVYDKETHCCVDNTLVVKDTSQLTPCDPPEPSSNARIPAQNAPIAASVYTEAYNTGFPDFYNVTAQHNIPSGTLTNMLQSFDGWQELTAYRSQSTECGVQIDGMTISQGEWDIDYAGIVGILAKSVVPGSNDLIKIATSVSFSGPTTAPSVYGGNGTDSRLQYGRVYKGNGHVTGGTWSGGSDQVTYTTQTPQGYTTTTGSQPVSLDQVADTNFPHVTHRICEIMCCEAGT